jgi:chaperonin GroEL
MGKINIDKIADVVKLTLGAKGKNIILPDGYITKDGVSVAKAFPENSLSDKIMKQVSLKTLDDVGDGTTSSTVLAQSIYNHFKNKNFQRISSQLDVEINLINKHIKELSKPIKTKANLYDIASISSNGDKEISKNVSEVCHKIGKDGSVTFEISDSNKSHYVIDSGYSIGDGVVSPDMLKFKSEVFENPYILVCKDELAGINQILKITEEIALKQKHPLIIVCDKVDTDVISTFIINRQQKNAKIAIVSTTDVDNKFENIAMLTNAFVIDGNQGKSSYDINKDWLGQCKKVILEKDKTVFVHDKTIENKPSEVKKKDWDKLISKVATFYVGAPSRLEVTEKLDRYDDALRSTMSSFEEGYCQGGGVVFLRVSKEVKLLRKPLKSLFIQMCKNAGYSKLKTEYLIFRLLRNNSVYDFRAEKFTDDGIYDSTKVLRITLESATGISKLLLNTAYVMEK